jgi:hypothetical protein
MSTNLTPVTEERNAAGSRLDVNLHDLLRAPSTAKAQVQPAEALALPTPVFPQHPELLTDNVLPSDAHGAPDDPYARRWTAPQVLRAMGGWLFPYVKSRVLPGDFPNPPLLRVFGAKTVPLRLYCILQYQHLPDEHGRCPAID